MRGKRAEYSERVFGQIKWNMGFKRFLLRGLKKVDIEWGLLCIAVDIRKMHMKDIQKKKEKERKIGKNGNINPHFIKKLITKKTQLIFNWIFLLGNLIYRTPSYINNIIYNTICKKS